MEDVLGGLTRTLDGRVYVALARGLWDLTAKEIFDYVEGLQENLENKVCCCVSLVSLLWDALPMLNTGYIPV